MLNETISSPVVELDSTQLCKVLHSSYPDNDRVIVIRNLDGRAISLTEQQAATLSQVSSVGSVNGWLEDLCKRYINKQIHGGKHPLISSALNLISVLLSKFEQPVDVQRFYRPLFDRYRDDLNTLIAAELIVPVSKFFEGFDGRQEIAEDPRGRITSLCIPTSGRSNLVQRCVRSFADSLHAHNRTDSRILVVDDSRDEKSERRNLEAINVIPELSNKTYPEILYIGHAVRHALIAQLGSQGVASPEVISFALYPQNIGVTTEGAVRNAITLLTRGEFILQADDDTSCEYVSTNRDESKVVISSTEEPCWTSFYPDRASNRATSSLISDIDPFAIHERILGKSFSQVLKTASSVEWNQTSPHAFVSTEGNLNRIDITTTGSSGDPGMNSPIGFLTVAPQETIERVYASDESYRVASTVREVLRSVPYVTISRRSSFLAMSFGMNNHLLYPPFFSQGRNLDYVFGILNRLVNRGSLIGHLPYAISHDSESSRTYHPNFAVAFCNVGTTGILEICLNALFYTNAPISQNLKSVGEQLCSLSSLSEREFCSFLRTQRSQSRLKIIDNLTSLLDAKHSSSQQWEQNMLFCIRAIRASIFDEMSIVPLDLIPIMGQVEALRVVQKWIGTYGMLMQSWCNIVAAASTIDMTSLCTYPDVECITDGRN